MDLQQIRQFSPDFDPTKHKVIPDTRFPLFPPEKFQTEEHHEAVEFSARELIRGSLQKQLGKVVYSQQEILDCHPKSTKAQKMHAQVVSGEATIR